MEKNYSLPYAGTDQMINAERNGIYGERNVIDIVNINDGDDIDQNYGNPVKEDLEPSASRVLEESSRDGHHPIEGDAKNIFHFIYKII